MADIAAVFERLKNNKFAIPALVVGGVAGVYVIMKNSGGGGVGMLSSDQMQQPPQEPISNGGGGGSGSGDMGGGNDAAIGELIMQQQGFAQQLLGLFESFGQGVQGALSAQAQQNQDTLNAIGTQQQGLYDAFASQMSAFASSFVPDYSQLASAVQSIPQYVQSFPQLELGGQSLNSSIAQIARTPINYGSIPGALGGKVISSRTPSLVGLGINMKPGISLGSASGYRPPTTYPVAKPTLGGGGLYSRPPTPTVRPTLPSLTPYPKLPPLKIGGGGTVGYK